MVEVGPRTEPAAHSSAGPSASEVQRSVSASRGLMLWSHATPNSFLHGGLNPGPDAFMAHTLSTELSPQILTIVFSVAP